jgi:predicted RND superfamily exporter protein
VWQWAGPEWALLQLQNSLFSNAMQGMALSIIFAFLVLIVTTKNYRVSLFAIASISLVICSIMATIYLCEWGIGTSESLALIIFVGFSVDYIVHMCHQYVDSIHELRINRVESCFQKIGVTLVNGAITSFSAGLLLYFCTFSSLHKFGVFMMTTIASALFFSLLFYPALSYSFGPEFKQGDVIHNIVNPIKEWLRERKL